MPRSVNYKVLEEFLKRTGTQENIESFLLEDFGSPEEMENKKFRLIQGAKAVIIDCDGNLEAALEWAKSAGLPVRPPDSLTR